jgi:hypothetical protein
MPTPFHTAMRVDMRPRERSGERALLEQRARMALADERSQRRQGRATSKRRFKTGAWLTVASLSVACAIGLLLVAF